MVKLLAELHGGTVAVESAVGEGSLLHGLAAAARAGEARRRRAPTRRPTPRRRGAAGARTALVVEDDDKAAELIRLQLEAEGFTVLHAATAEAALVLAPQQPLSLITLDIMLPDMDGWEFLESHQAGAGAGARPGRDHLDRGRPQQGLRAAAPRRSCRSRSAAPELYDVARRPGPASVPQEQTLTVLVVDDDPKAVELIAAAPAGPGLRGAARLRRRARRSTLARRELPDLIVLDLMMPEVNGFDVVEALQRNARHGAHPDPGGHRQADHRRRTAPRSNGSGRSSTIVEKAGFDRDRFIAEVRRAMSAAARRRLTWPESWSSKTTRPT